MTRKLVVGLALCITLSGCDKLQDYMKTQAGIEQHLARIEETLSLLKDRMLALDKNSQENVTSFQDCVLKNMKGIASDLAAEAVKESCLRKFSYPILDLSGLRDSKAVYGQIYGYSERLFGLHIILDNRTLFTITELTFFVRDKKSNLTNTYVVQYFPSPMAPNTIVTGLPRDRTLGMQLSRGQHVFTKVTTEFAQDFGKFFEQYVWGLESAKGFLN